MADIYDTAFHTVLNDCSELIIPLINISFGEHYTGNERIGFSRMNISLTSRTHPIKKDNRYKFRGLWRDQKNILLGMPEYS